MKAETLQAPLASLLGIDARHPYTQLSHIPWCPQPDGSVLLDQMWSKDLRALRDRVGFVHIIAPQAAANDDKLCWGTSSSRILPDEQIRFSALPDLHSWQGMLAFWRMWPQLRDSGVLHTNNQFGRHLLLIAMLGKAARHGVNTIYVQPEDFADVMAWEWVRLAANPWQFLKRELTRRLTLAAARYAVSVADASFSFGGGAQQKLRLHARNLAVIYHALHRSEDCISAAQLAAKQQRAAGSPLRLIMACRHTALKGLDHALLAISHARHHAPLQLTLYGHGPQNAELRQLCTQLQLQEVVTFAGTLPHGAALYQAIAEHDVMLMPHRTNDFGRAATDALASGTPIVAYRTETAAALIRDGVDGWLAECDSPLALANQLIWLQQHRSQLASAMAEAAARGQRETLDCWNDFRLQQLAHAVSKRRQAS